MISAIVLCGGCGSRLSPITDKYPKPLIPIMNNGKTNIENIIKICDNSKVSEIIIVISDNKLDRYKEVVENIDVKSNIKLIVNEEALTTNNITSFIKGVSNLDRNCEGSFIIDGDTYITGDELPFIPDRSTFFVENRENEWGFIFNDKGRVVDFDKHHTGYCMSGVSYIDIYDLDYLMVQYVIRKFSKDIYWEEFLRLNLVDINIDIKIFKLRDGYTKEYDNINDLINIIGADKAIGLIPGINKIYGKLDSMTNDSYLVDYNGEKYVLRIPGVGSDELTHRESEEKIIDMIKDIDISPESIYIGSVNKLKLSKYIENSRVWNSYKEDEFIPDILKKCCVIHNLDCNTNLYRLDPFVEIKKYFGLAGKFSKSENEDVRNILNTYRRLRKINEIYNIGDNLTYIHGDLINSNIIIDNNNKVYLIDFEYTGFCDFHWDLGDLLSEMTIYDKPIEDDNVILNYAMEISYEYNKLSNLHVATTESVLAWCAMTHFIWSIWGYAKTELGEDQLEYARLRLKYCDKCLDILDKYYISGGNIHGDK